MPQDDAKDINAIKEWISNETYLPQDLDDKMILKFLHSCYFNLENTKTCIDRFCSTRAQMPEVYRDRDPLSPAMQTILKHTLISSYKFNNNQFFIYKYDDPTLETFQFYNVLKGLSIQTDVWFKSCQTLADELYVIIDMSYYSFKMVPRVNILYFKNFLVHLLESTPVRVTKVIGINAPSYYDKLYALVKPILPPEIKRIIHFFTDYEGMYQMIDRKYLPKEYGGEAESMYEQYQDWCKRIQEERDFLLNENSWKVDVMKKSKTHNKSMSDFKTLSID